MSILHRLMSTGSTTGGCTATAARSRPQRWKPAYHSSGPTSNPPGCRRAFRPWSRCSFELFREQCDPVIWNTWVRCQPRSRPADCVAALRISPRRSAAVIAQCHRSGRLVPASGSSWCRSRRAARLRRLPARGGHRAAWAFQRDRWKRALAVVWCAGLAVLGFGATSAVFDRLSPADRRPGFAVSAAAARSGRAVYPRWRPGSPCTSAGPRHAKHVGGRAIRPPPRE